MPFASTAASSASAWRPWARASSQRLRWPRAAPRSSSSAAARGATVAGTLKLANAKLDVTLIEPAALSTPPASCRISISVVCARARASHSHMMGSAPPASALSATAPPSIDLAKKSVSLAGGGDDRHTTASSSPPASALNTTRSRATARKPRRSCRRPGAAGRS